MPKKELRELSKMVCEKGVTTVRIKNGIYNQVKKICEKDNFSKVDYINLAVLEKIKREL